MPYCRSDVPLLLRGHRGGSFLRVGGQEGQRGSGWVEQGRSRAGAQAGWGGVWVPGCAEHHQESPGPLHWKPGPGPLPVPRGVHGAQRCGDYSRSERWPQAVPQGPAGMGLEAACQLAGTFPIPQHSPNPRTAVAGRVLSREETSAVLVTFRLIFIHQ